MRFIEKVKDGGPESKVWGFWLIELKDWGSQLASRGRAK